MVSGCGFTSLSGSAKLTAWPPSEQLRGERRDGDGGVDRLVVEGERVLRERQHLDVDVVDRQAGGLQHLADLVGRDRALAVGRDGLALELLEVGDLALMVGAQHEVMAERARHPVEHHGDRQVLLQRVEVARRNAAFHELQLVLGQQRDRVGGGIEVLVHDLDAELLEVALLDRPQDRDGGDRAHRADLDGNLLRGRDADAGDHGKTGQQRLLQHDHGQALPSVSLWRSRALSLSCGLAADRANLASGERRPRSSGWRFLRPPLFEDRLTHGGATQAAAFSRRPRASLGPAAGPQDPARAVRNGPQPPAACWQYPPMPYESAGSPPA